MFFYLSALSAFPHPAWDRLHRRCYETLATHGCAMEVGHWLGGERPRHACHVSGCVVVRVVGIGNSYVCGLKETGEHRVAT